MSAQRARRDGRDRRIEGLGVVLSSADSRDDRIVRILMDNDELVPAVVRYGRKTQRRSGPKGALVQPLSLIRTVLSAGASEDLAVLDEAALEDAHATLKGDLLRTALGLAMTEVTLHLIPDWGVDPGAHDLLVRALVHLDKPGVQASEELHLLFLLRSLDRAGVLPPLDEVVEIPVAAREVLTAWREGRWAVLPGGTARAVARFLEGALTAMSGRQLQVRRFLDDALG